MKILLIVSIMLSLTVAKEPYSYDPFNKPPIIIEKKQNISNLPTIPTPIKKPTLSLHVEAVMSKRAFINKEWYGLGDKIESYSLYMIRPKIVGFKDGEKVYIVPVGGGQSILSIKERK